MVDFGWKWEVEGCGGDGLGYSASCLCCGGEGEMDERVGVEGALSSGDMGDREACEGRRPESVGSGGFGNRLMLIGLAVPGGGGVSSPLTSRSESDIDMSDDMIVLDLER